MVLPERDGIPPSRVYLDEGPWERVIDFLYDRFPRIAPEILRERLAAGEIFDEYGRPVLPAAPYRPGRWLWYYREVPNEVPVPFELPVLYRDQRLVVADKPHFMASTPGGRYLRHTALVRLRRELDLPSLSPMHRLDRDTAGVLLFCADPKLRGRYQALFQARAVRKEYEAVAALPPDLMFPLQYCSRLEERPGEFIMREVDGAPNSETRIELLSTLDAGKLAHFRLLPVTGRKHQLRVHMSALGMPIMNDAYYPTLLEEPAADDFRRPLQLLARAVEFRDPVDGRMHRYESSRMLDTVLQARSIMPGN